MRHERDREALAVDRRDGQRDAVDRDRPFLDDVAEKVGRHVDPDRHTVGIDRRAIFGIDKRAASSGDHDVTGRQQRENHLTLQRAEVGLALAREDLRHGAAFARFHEHVHVFGAPAEPPRQRLSQRRLAGAHESDQIDLVRLHAITNERRIPNVPEKGSGVGH